MLNSFESLMLAAAKLVTPFTYPTGWERLAIDDNVSAWVEATLDYTPRPPLTGDDSADLAIIGGGFTGVSTAYYFSRRYPNKRVVLLEAKTLANGASGRNGGMVLNWINGVEDTSPEMTRLVYDTTKSGIDAIENLITTHNLPVSYRRDGALQVFTSPERAEAAHQHGEWLNSIGIPVQFLDKATLKTAIPLQGAYGALLDTSEGQMNGAQFVRAMRPLIESQGVQIYEGTPVLTVREGNTITLTTPRGEVKAKAIVLATNGYTGKLGYFRKAFFPLHSHVLATPPLTDEQKAALGWLAYSGFSDDYDRISYSTMTRDGRLIFGGGSNAAYLYRFNNGTASPPPDALPGAFAAMHQTLLDYLPGLRGVPITRRWSGTLSITFRRNPSMGVIGDSRNVFYALGYSGHGVTLANLAGQVLTDIYSGDDQQWRALPFYQARLDPIPLEPFRWLGYQMFTRLTGKSPRAR